MSMFRLTNISWNVRNVAVLVPFKPNLLEGKRPISPSEPFSGVNFCNSDFILCSSKYKIYLVLDWTFVIKQQKTLESVVQNHIRRLQEGLANILTVFIIYDYYLTGNHNMDPVLIRILPILNKWIVWFQLFQRTSSGFRVKTPDFHPAITETLKKNLKQAFTDFNLCTKDLRIRRNQKHELVLFYE